MLDSWPFLQNVKHPSHPRHMELSTFSRGRPRCCFITSPYLYYYLMESHKILNNNIKRTKIIINEIAYQEEKI